MSKIYVFTDYDSGPEEFIGVAVSAAGDIIATHISSSLYWLGKDMGLDPEYPSHFKHKLYQRAFPDGYQLVDLINLTYDQLQAHPEVGPILKQWDKEDPPDATSERQDS